MKEKIINISQEEENQWHFRVIIEIKGMVKAKPDITKVQGLGQKIKTYLNFNIGLSFVQNKMLC